MIPLRCNHCGDLGATQRLAAVLVCTSCMSTDVDLDDAAPKLARREFLAVGEAPVTRCPPDAPIEQRLLATVRSANPHLPLDQARRIVGMTLDRYPALRGQ